MKKKKDLFSHIVWKNFLYNKREFSLIVFCEILIIAFSFAGAACYQVLSNSHSQEYFLSEDGIGKIFSSAAIPFLICGVILIIVVMITYFGKRMPDYVMFQRMGITKRDMNRLLMMEVAISYVVSLVFGLLLGNVLFLVVKKILVRQLGETNVSGGVSIWLYMVICGITLGVYFLGILLIKELESDFRILTVTRESARKETVKLRVPFVWIALGFLLCIVAVLFYSKVYRYENIFLLVTFFIGLYLIFRHVAVWFLTKRKNKRGYLKHLLVRNQFYYRFKTISRYLFVFSILAGWAAFYFAMQFVTVQTAQPIDSLFPYDFMCIANEEDMDFFDSLQQKYELDFTEYPMVRVSNTDKTEWLEQYMEQRIQGQQIGISESTYHILKQKLEPGYKKRSLGLDKDGMKVYLVHQQDRSVKAQPIDWFYMMKKPNLHVGVVCPAYHWGIDANTFYERTVVGEEFGSLTGCFTQVKLENLVVFSDEYFEKAKEEWKTTDAITSLREEDMKRMEGEDYEIVTIQGPTRLVLFNAREEDVDSIDNELEKLEEEHKYIANYSNYDAQVRFHYNAKTQKQDLKTERMLKAVINLFMMITFMIIGAIFFLVRMRIEFREKSERADFLRKMGMSEKQRKALYKKETMVFYYVPMLVMLLVVCFFSAATFHVRMFETDVIVRCVRLEVLICGVYMVMQGIYAYLLSEIFARKVERSERR